jgi:hypothetical protein
VVRRVSGLDDRVLVILRMGCRKVSAVIIQVVDLLSVIGQRISGDLPSSNTAAISEHCEKQSIHAAAFLKDIKDFLSPFIDE